MSTCTVSTPTSACRRTGKTAFGGNLFTWLNIRLKLRQLVGPASRVQMAWGAHRPTKHKTPPWRGPTDLRSTRRRPGGGPPTYEAQDAALAGAHRPTKHKTPPRRGPTDLRSTRRRPGGGPPTYEAQDAAPAGRRSPLRQAGQQ